MLYVTTYYTIKLCMHACVTSQHLYVAAKVASQIYSYTIGYIYHVTESGFHCDNRLTS